MVRVLYTGDVIIGKHVRKEEGKDASFQLTEPLMNGDQLQVISDQRFTSEFDNLRVEVPLYDYQFTVTDVEKSKIIRLKFIQQEKEGAVDLEGQAAVLDINVNPGPTTDELCKSDTQVATLAGAH